MITEKDQALVEKFVDGDMTPNQVSDFQQRIEEDPEIRKAIKAYQVSLEAVDMLAEKHLDDKLQSLRQEAEAKPMRKISRWKGWGAIAASVLILIFAVGGLYSNQFTSKNLSQQYFERYEAASRGDQLESAMQSYQDGDYERSIDLFNGVLQNDPSDIIARFYLAQSYFLTGDFELAHDSFEIVHDSGDLRYAEASEWFAVLSLVNYNEDRAKEKLQLLIDGPSSYRTEGLELQQKLESFWHF